MGKNTLFFEFSLLYMEKKGFPVLFLLSLYIRKKR